MKTKEEHKGLALIVTTTQLHISYIKENLTYLNK